jgi:glycosyltransferase involved in cell wall biosynthesis
MKMVSKRINKRVELYVVDPLVKIESVKLVGSITIRYIKPLSHMNFLRLVANSDLFVELNDEELRQSTIEAALLGAPVAKLTHPLFKDRCDYGEDDLIQACPFKELADRIAEYVQNVELYYNIYSKALQDFILKFRTWNHVKRQLVEYLKEV